MDVQARGTVFRRTSTIWRRAALVALVVPALLMMVSAAPAMAAGGEREGFDPNLAPAPRGMLSAQALTGGLTVANMLVNTPAGLVATLVGNSSIPVSNIQYTGAQVAAGTFAGGDGIIGFDSGIILSTGNIKNVIGPNRYDNVTTVNGTAGDTSLNGPGYTTRDAAALEFDFIPNSNTITFQYVFASDEYNEYANAQYNDKFAFFVNGVNKALIPGTTTPVSINTINGGNPLGTNPQNPQYYINNARPGATLNTEMDGMTVVLTLQSSVNPGQINHLKLVIADVNDSKFDSNVFIKAGTFMDVALPPMTAAAALPSANGAGWNNTDVTVSMHATPQSAGDTVKEIHYQIGSGPEVVDPGADASFPVTAEGTITVSYYAVSTQGGTEQPKSLTVKVDKTKPVITGAPYREPNANGWYNDDVPITFSCSDDRSGIAFCPAPTLTGEGANQSMTGQAKDAADNTNTFTVTGLNLDKTPPTITGAPDRPANADGWYNAPVTISFTCNDALSGIDTCTQPATLTGEGTNQTVDGTAVDKAGNAKTASVSGINIDLVAPVTTATAPTGWQTTDATVTFAATDNGSGVAKTYYEVDGGAPQVGTSLTLSTEGIHAIQYWSVDRAGNEEPIQIVSVQIDKTAPAITHALNPAPNADGWNNTDVTVTFVCDDANGIATCPDPVTVTNEGQGQVVTGTASDIAGRTATDNATVNLDKTAPTISGAPDRQANADGWYNAPVTVTFTCSDALSGAVACPADVTLAGEGQDQSATGTVADKAGNAASAVTAGINIDRTPPVTTATAPTGWQTADPTVTFAATDNLSGVKETYYTVDGGATQTGPSLTLTTEGAHTVQYWSVDLAGNAEQAKSVTVQIDKGAPTIAHSLTPTPNAEGWNNTDVVVAFTCNDTNGIGSCSDPSTLTAEGAGQTVVGQATDTAGNTATDTVTVNIDKTAPTVTAAADRQPNDDGWYNGSVTGTFTCGDSLSGIAACPEAVHFSGEGAGQHASGVAADKAGNQAEAAIDNINIDLTPPVTTADAPSGWQNSPVTVHFTATDNLSGVKQTYYTVDGGAPQTGAGATVTTDGIHTIQYWSVDLAGNAEQAQSVTVEIDKAAPTITYTLTPAPNANGWNRTPVVVTFTCRDSNGIAACTGDTRVVAEGAGLTVTGTATDIAGNTTTIQVPLSIDMTPPTIVAHRDLQPNVDGWYNAPVTVTFTCSDGPSGLATCPDPITLATEGRNQSVTGTATDLAGIASSAMVDGINIDMTAPVTTATAPAGWQKDDVPVTLAATDNLSGVTATYYTVDGGAPQTGTGLTVTAEGTHTIQFWSVDLAGNVEQAKTVTVQIDRTAPTITHTRIPAPNAAGWNNTDVAVAFICDDTNGIASCTGSTTVTTEGQGQVVTGTATDVAGNTTTDTVTLNIDKTAPVTTATAPAGWQNSDVTVTLAATDNLSGVTATYYRVDGGAPQTGTGLTVTAEGTHTVQYWSADAAGNTEQARTVTIQIDRAAPAITHTQTPAPNAAGWNNTDVAVAFTCTDTNGIAACTGSTTVAAEGQGQVITGTATDVAGNTTTDQVTLNIDKTAPAITYAGNQGTYMLNDMVNITCTASDNLSGVASSTCTPISAPAYTFGEGTHTFTASAMDKAGNAGTGSVTFTVILPTTPDAACALIEKVVPQHGVANSLCVKIRNAAAAKDRGDYGAAFNILEAFKQEVAAQADKWIVPGGKETLLKLANTLEAMLPPTPPDDPDKDDKHK